MVVTRNSTACPKFRLTGFSLEGSFSKLSTHHLLRFRLRLRTLSSINPSNAKPRYNFHDVFVAQEESTQSCWTEHSDCQFRVGAAVACVVLAALECDIDPGTRHSKTGSSPTSNSCVDNTTRICCSTTRTSSPTASNSFSPGSRGQSNVQLPIFYLPEHH